jgi:hypothetical protein
LSEHRLDRREASSIDRLALPVESTRRVNA